MSDISCNGVFSNVFVGPSIKHLLEDFDLNQIRYRAH